MSSGFPLVELRQYLLRPSRRDELIELFEREFVESQEALGMRLFGLFCDAERPDYFVWLRGFRDMQSRGEALEQFYGGPVWKTHGGAANATMIDSDNVLLLREAQPSRGLDPVGAIVPAPLLCVIFSLSHASDCDRFALQFLSEVRPQAVLAAYVTESSPNTFPCLPVREGEHHVVLVFASGIQREDLPASFILNASQIIDLVPTRRSRLQMSTNATQATAGGSHGFDFLFGRWKIHNRRLRYPLTGSNDWYEFESTSTESPLLGGHGNLEQYDAPVTPAGPIHAVAVRLYNAKTDQWSIYWSTRDSGAFGVPTVGSIKDGVGMFFDHEDYNGRTILVRFIWTHSGRSSCRWEQAFSPDDGKTWEVNWTMDFSRL
jgi:NIPSNAP